jgi:hypothetical protein
MLLSEIRCRRFRLDCGTTPQSRRRATAGRNLSAFNDFAVTFARESENVIAGALGVGT